MRKFIIFIIFSVVIVACAPKQQKPVNNEPVKTEVAKPAPTNELGMWKIATYASNLGDKRNSSYLTNSYAIWGTFTDNANDNAELKVKFLIDKETFCIKLLAHGTQAVKKGDENLYKIKVKSSANDQIEFTAKNISDRIFIKSVDSQKIIDLFNKGGVITFSLVSDSKTAPARYAFAIDNPDGFGNAYKKLSE
jgi:hypothetical protein